MAKFSKLGIVKLPPIVRYDYVRNPESADYVLPCEAGDLGFCDHRCWLGFHTFCEVINCDDEELKLLPSHRSGPIISIPYWVKGQGAVIGVIGFAGHVWTFVMCWHWLDALTRLCASFCSVG